MEFVTITHPYHPLKGQQVEVVRVLRGPDPDLIVRFPDGRHTAYAQTLDDLKAGYRYVAHGGVRLDG